MTSAFLTLTKGQGHNSRSKVTDVEVSAFSECFLFLYPFSFFSQGKSFAFGVMIILNFILFVTIAVGQLAIFWTVRKSKIRSSTSNKSSEVTLAYRLATVVLR